MGSRNAHDLTLALAVDQEAWDHETQMDGCYVIKTDLPGNTATGLSRQLLSSAKITLPGALPLRKVYAATRKKSQGIKLYLYIVRLCHLLDFLFLEHPVRRKELLANAIPARA